MSIDISGVKDRAVLLMELYNAARKPVVSPRSGIAVKSPDMTIVEARRQIDSRQSYFRTINGRVLNFGLSGPKLDPLLYDAANGAGVARRVVEKVTSGQTRAAQVVGIKSVKAPAKRPPGPPTARI